MSRIYIVLPVHNRRRVTERFVDCLCAQTYADYHLLLVDDGCSDGTAQMVVGKVPGSVILSGDGNLWWAGSLQKAYDWLRSHSVDARDLVLIINDDTRIAPEFLATAVELLEEKTAIMLHAQCREEGSNKLLDDGVQVDWPRLRFTQVHQSDQVSCLSTRGLFLRVSDFLASGGFRPGLLPHYLSDYEFTIRLQRQGVKPIIDPRLQLWTHRHVIPQPVTGWRAAWQAMRCRRNPSNLRAWLAFVLMSCPWPWKPLCLLRVFQFASVRFAKLALGRG